MKNNINAVKVKGERVWRTYLGGRELDKIHGSIAPEDSQFPEEWMFSMTKANNAGRENIVEGICYLEGEKKINIKDWIESNPIEILGENHFKEYNASMGVLIKLIDSKERLTVQVHPDQKKAMELFNSRFGKTECWHILETRDDMEEPPCIYIGFKEGITLEMWKDCFERQDYDGMLELMHRVEVKKGETYIIYGGVPHAIGAGCLIMEVQEPTDYTIRVERVTPAGLIIDDFMCHQGIGFDRMFDCFNYEGKSLKEAIEHWRLVPKVVETDEGYIVKRLVGYENTNCFKMDKVIIDDKVKMREEETFVCIYVIKGKGILSHGDNILALEPNDQIFVPASIKDYTVENLGMDSLELLKCYGPRT